jgi:hypothetical protein
MNSSPSSEADRIGWEGRILKEAKLIVLEPSSISPQEARHVLTSYLKEVTGVHNEGAVRPTDPPLVS